MKPQQKDYDKKKTIQTETEKMFINMIEVHV